MAENQTVVTAIDSYFVTGPVVTGQNFLCQRCFQIILYGSFQGPGTVNRIVTGLAQEVF